MASHWYTKALQEVMDGTIDLDTNTLKLMLVNSTYTPVKTTTIVDDGTGSDIQSAEITATNYTRGWGGAGRKTATCVVAADQTNNWSKVTISNLTWTALGGAANDTVVAAVLIKEGGSNDTTSRPIAYFDLTDTPTNGSDFTVTFNATDGNLRITS